MKRAKTIFLFCFTITLLISTEKPLWAQTISDFEDLTLGTDSFWNGSDMSKGFTSGNASFSNVFIDWGSGVTSWSGFSYSNMSDTLTQIYTNEFSAMTGRGYNGSDNYAIGYVSSFDPLPRVRLDGIAKGDTVSGFFITNSTYSYLTMKNGGGQAKIFGGVNGTDPDYFAVSVRAYKDGIRKPDSVLYYLADFRFASSAEDYIIKNWQWVDLKILGKVDSLEFNLFSSDTGAFGINNPTYFCMDNLITNYNSSAGIQNYTQQRFTVHPNPSEDFISISPFSESDHVRILDMMGQQMPINIENSMIDIRALAKGVYLIEIENNYSVSCSKFIKK